MLSSSIKSPHNITFSLVVQCFFSLRNICVFYLLCMYILPLHLLAGLTAVNHSLTFENCFTNVCCYSPKDEGECSVRYGLDSYNRDPTITGSLNSNFTLPFTKPMALYYYQINVTSNYTVQFQGNFTTGECELINFYLINTTPVRSWVVSCLSVCSYFTAGECELINFYHINTTPVRSRVVSFLSVCSYFTTGECELINFYLINITPVRSWVVSCLSVCSYFTTGECELINFYLINITPVRSWVVSCLSVCSYFTTGECELINFYLINTTHVRSRIVSCL